MTLPLITAELLKSKKACKDQVALFKTVFPNGTKPTKAACLKAAKAGLDLDWAVFNLLDASAWDAYNRAIAPVMSAYHKAAARAADAAARAAARDAYYKAIASALANTFRGMK